MPLRPLRIVSILACAALLGLCWNGLSGRGFALTQNAYLQEGDAEVGAPEARTRLDQGALFLDARPIAFYEMSHIPGALPLPEDDFDRSFAKIEPRLRSSFDIVVYCSGFGCEASHLVARKLRDRGIPAIVLAEGWPAWTDAGYPVKEGPRP
ncbi:MAG TPA: rhodanese-like domain-containing protein [Vicinamibacteria bacterium]|nr:rhodanese-like domain-containing protein [Vicinamibacteria bacterium]